MVDSFSVFNLRGVPFDFTFNGVEQGMGGQFRVNGLVKDAAGLGRVFVVDAASAGQAVGRCEIGQGFGVLVSFVLLEEDGDVGGLFQAGRGDTTF